MNNLFSYGTLQQENVQLAIFGRVLSGKTDILVGYIVTEIKITDNEVVKKSGKLFHPILKKTANIDNKVYGTVFTLTHEELRLADKYEVDSYIRKEATLSSGSKAWIYTENI